MCDRYTRRTKPYLPRYQPLPSAAALRNRRRCSNPLTASYSRELTYYIDGSPTRVINSYHVPNSPSCNKTSRIFLFPPGSGHYLTRVTGRASFHDLSASHVYTNPGNILDASTRRGDDDNVGICQDNFHSSSLGLDMTLSESGVSVGESEDWSVFGREIDNISQRSSNSWSTFCEASGDNDLERRDLDSFSGVDFLGDESCDFHYSNNDADNNFRYENQTDCMPNQDSQIPENTFYMHSHDGDVEETLKNGGSGWQSENREDQLADFPTCALNLESHPGMLDETLKYNTRQTTEQTLAQTARNACRENWQCESHDSVVSDTSYSSEWRIFPQVGEFDHFRSLPDLGISKLEAKREYFSCDNGFSEDFYSDVLDSALSSVSGDVEVTRTRGNVEMTRTHGDKGLTRTPGDIEQIRTDGYIEVTKTHGDMKFTKRHGDMQLRITSGDMELRRTSGDMELRRTSGDMELRRTSGDIELTKTSGDIELSRASGDIELTRTSGDIELTRTSDDIEMKRTSSDIELTRTSSDIELTRTSDDIELTRTSSDMELTKPHGDMKFTRTSGDAEVIRPDINMEATKTYGDMELTKTHCNMELTNTEGNMKLTRTHCDMELTTTHGDMELTTTRCDMELTRAHGDMELTRTHGDKELTNTQGHMKLTRTHGDMQLTNTHGGMELTRPPGDTELIRTRSDMEVKRTHSDPRVTRCYSSPNTLIMSGGDNAHSRVNRLDKAQCETCSFEDCVDSVDGVQTVRDVNSVEVQGGTHVHNVTNRVHVGTHVYSVADRVQEGTNVYSVTEVQKGTCEYSEGEEVHDGTDLHSEEEEVQEGTYVYSEEEEVQVGTYVYSEEEEVQVGTEVHSEEEEVQEGTYVYSEEEEVQVGTGAHSEEEEVQEGAYVYSEEEEVQEGTYVYSEKEEVQKGTYVYSEKEEVQKGTYVYSEEEEVQKSTYVYSEEEEVQKGTYVYSEKEEVQKGTYVYSEKEEVQVGTGVHSEEEEVQEGACVYSEEEEVQKVLCVYSEEDKVKDGTSVPSEEEELQEGTDVCSGKDMNKHHSRSNDNSAVSLKYRTTECYRAAVKGDVKEHVPEMPSKHQFITPGETFHEADSLLESRHESSSSGTNSENQILDQIGNVQKNDATGVQKYNQHADVQTDRLSYCQDNKIKDGVKLYASTISQIVQSTDTRGMSREDRGDCPRDSNYSRDDLEKENDFPCSREMADDDIITSSVSARNLLPFVGHVVDKHLVRYSGAGDTTKAQYTRLNSRKCCEDIKDTDSDNASLFLLPEIMSKEDVNSWDFLGVAGQRCVDTPDGCVIDPGSESTDVRDEQTQVNQSSVCLQDSASVDSGIYNNNTRVEHVIDSSRADVECLSCCSEFWEETQSSEAVLEKTGSIKNKHTDIRINTNPGHEQPVKQRTAPVTQQFENQFVVSFDSCDTSGGFHLCVYCGKRIKTYLYSRVCSRCMCHLPNENLADYEKVINNCCRREDIDSCAGIPVSILDESITHAREKLGRDKGTQHVHHFCAETQGVGSGKTGEIISYSSSKEQTANKSSSENYRDNHAVDHQNTLDTESVDNILLSISRAGTDKSSNNVFSDISNTLDTAARISDSCQTSSWNILYSDLTTQDSVSIDITSANTSSSTRSSCVPSDFINSTSSPINSTSSPDIRLRSEENLPAPTCLTSPASSIVSRDTTADIQTMKGNGGNLDMNSSTSCVNIDLDYLVSLTDSTHRNRDSVSSPTGLFTSSCHVNPLDNLHAQLSFISGNSFNARSPVSGYVPTDIYMDRAEATCTWKSSSVGGFSDAVGSSHKIRDHAVGSSHKIRDHAVKQTILDPAAGKEHLGRSRNWNESSPTVSDSLEFADTKEEYDNDDTYVTAATTFRGSRLLPRSYHHMQLFKYGQAKVSSLWTVPEEPENICEETSPHASSTLSVAASLTRNSPSDQTMFVSRMPFTTEDDTAPRKYSSVNNTNSKKCTMSLGSSISIGDNHGAFETEDNDSTHLSARSARGLCSLLERDHVSSDLSSSRTYSRPVGDHTSVECGHDEIGTCGRHLADGDKNNVDSCTAHDSPDIPRQGCGDSSAGEQGMNYNFSNGIRHKHPAVCAQVPQESSTDNLSVLDRLTESLSQFRRHGVDVVYATKSLFREDAADSDTESQQSLSGSITVHGKHTDRSDVSDLGYNDSFTSDLDSNTSTDSIRHTHFTSTGKAEVKEADDNDYDNAFCPRPVLIKSHLKKTQTDLEEIGKYSDINVNHFETIEEETNTSVSQLQEKAQMMPPQNECAAKTYLLTPDCEDLYRAFTNEDAEKQQNHTCIVLEDEFVIKYRFKRFLKKSHAKRKKGLKVLNFFSRLSCVSGTASSPITSPVLPRKLCNKQDTFLQAEPKVLPQQTMSDALLVNSSSSHHHEIDSLSSVGHCSSPSSSNQSLDSVPSKTDSAYSSFSESLEATVNSPGSVSRSNSQIHDVHKHFFTSVNMDSSIGSYSSSLDCSARRLEFGGVHTGALNGADLRTAAPKHAALMSTDTMSDVLDELNRCQGRIDTGLLNHMRYGHRPAKVDQTWA